MHKQVNHFIFFLILMLICLSSFGQMTTVYMGFGLAPLHQTVQNDFQNNQPPFRGLIELKRNRLAVQASFSANASYIKENFTFKHLGPSLSFLYYFKKSLQKGRIEPYLRIGANYKLTQFSTQGYPGIRSYELKIEKDGSIGIDFAFGIKYPLKTILLGIELNYSKNSPSRFLAGGFSPQNLNSDHFLAEFNIAVPISNKRLATACPNL